MFHLEQGRPTRSREEDTTNSVNRFRSVPGIREVNRTTIEPSPTADGHPVHRAGADVPAANTPGTLVSRGIGSRRFFRMRAHAALASRSRPVSTNPLASRSTVVSPAGSENPTALIRYLLLVCGRALACFSLAC